MFKKVTPLLLLFGALFQFCSRPVLTVDDQLPAGNIVMERVSGDTVYVSQDLSKNADEWFYWAMRVRGAQGKTLVFQFPRTSVGARGPVVSLDQGKTFFFGGEANDDNFTWTFGPKDKDVYFYECHPYLPENWEAFTNTLDKSLFSQSVLCISREGREVPYASVGLKDGKERHHIFIMARHHCSETMASYVMEGLVMGLCASDKVGEWLRDNVDMTLVPFADYDGVVDGDQGKNRAPHDHNRDYGLFLYPETRAIADLYGKTHAEVFLDLHCPWINTQYVHNSLSNPAITPDMEAEARFTECVERNAFGLPYHSSNNVPFGTDWNNKANYSNGTTCLNWARLHAPDARVCRCFEIPFANAEGTEVNPESCRAFGKSLAAALVDFFQK